MIGRLAGFAAPALAQALLWVGIALLVSVAGNVWQFQRAAFAAGEQSAQTKAASDLASVVGEVEALRETAARTVGIAQGAAAEQAKLASVFRAIADDAKDERVVYRDRIKLMPAATCAPGAERMEAFNEAMRQ